MLLLNMKKIKETGLSCKSKKIDKRKEDAFADQDAIFWSTTKKKLLPRIYNEQSRFNKKILSFATLQKGLCFGHIHIQKTSNNGIYQKFHTVLKVPCI